MKTQQQKINWARKKVGKFQEDLEKFIGKIDAVVCEFDDDGFSERMGTVMDALSDIIDGGRGGFTDVLEFLDEYQETICDQEEESDDD